MRTLHHHFVAGQCQSGFEQAFGFPFELAELLQQHVNIGLLEVVGGLLNFILEIHVVITHARRPFEVVDAFFLLQIHRQAFQTVGDLAHDRFAGNAADFLEVGELGHFHAIQPDFPAQTPGAECR